jgi:hypothetical protein
LGVVLVVPEGEEIIAAVDHIFAGHVVVTAVDQSG